MNKCQVITMIAVAGLTGSVLAQDKTTEKTTEKTTTRHEEIRHERSANDRMNAGEQYLVPSSRAIGVPVKGADGAHLGDVKEAVIRGSSGRVVYVLVTKGLKPVAGEPTASITTSAPRPPVVAMPRMRGPMLASKAAWSAASHKRWAVKSLAKVSMTRGIIAATISTSGFIQSPLE